ncbi:MAG: hypothetical protein LBG67_05770, partial [Campylobacteraceae bacterium]|nr:hypothetical protein [Campylobacteraceae bacterium]
MYRHSFIVIFIILFFYGCANQAKINYYENLTEHTLSKNEVGDLLVLKALFSTQDHDFENAIKYFKELYDMFDDKSYLTNAIRLSLTQNNITFSGKLAKEGYEKYQDDNDIKRLYIAQLIKEDNIEEAKNITKQLLQYERNEQNYRLLGTIYVFQNSLQEAITSYEEAYKIGKNEQVFVQIADLHIRLNNTNKAISLLETYTRINGCTPIVCSKLISIYNDLISASGKNIGTINKNINNLLEVYIKAYKAFEDTESAQKIVELYMHKNEIKKAVSFLEKSKHNPLLLIDLYAHQKQFSKATELAYERYRDTNDIAYLAKATVYTYEGNSNKKSVLDEVTKNFEIVVAELDEPLFLNYYGYLLIDYDIDILRGIELVKNALVKEPNSH